ncbi:NUDIX hydrolase [Inquilinus limosus]|uniref:NUDIX hydrolase n=1 Tax=Inquilinus limosus TaxID=171674 RepID=A0A211YXT9_9PROT|nr:NUDIX domain-containing protein [Inquilinus limosus]OWJ57833.1 NUDIX hydrolase [Inquilinus limosus]
MQEIPIRSVAVAVVVIRHAAAGPQVLLLRRTRSLAGEWCQVTGAVEPGETGWQAALRETREETGLVPERLYSADICEQFYEAERNVISLLPVFVAVAAPDAEVRLNAEHSEFRWAGFGEAAGMVPFAGQRHILRHVEREFVQREPSRWLLIQPSG